MCVAKHSLRTAKNSESLCSKAINIWICNVPTLMLVKTRWNSGGENVATEMRLQNAVRTRRVPTKAAEPRSTKPSVAERELWSRVDVMPRTDFFVTRVHRTVRLHTFSRLSHCFGNVERFPFWHNLHNYKMLLMRTCRLI